jgi:CRP-like cAMP-binding protein
MLLRKILAASQLFSGLDERSLDEIASAASVRKAARQEMIFFEGETAEALFIVGRGKVKIFKVSPDGKEQILMIAGPEDSFAEAALFAGNKYPASAQALEESEIAVISRERFVKLLGEDPDLAVNLIARLSALLRKLATLVEELSLTDVTTRVAHHLLTQIGLNSQANSKITLSEKKTVLASMIGTIPETLSRSLAKLVREKVIAVDGPNVQILDMQKLKELAGE